MVLLGYTIRQGRIMPESSLVSKIISIQVPKTKIPVRSLLGLINFYSPFILKYAAVMACLKELTAGPVTKIMIKWSPLHNVALVNIRMALSSKPFLQLPDLYLDVFVFTDCPSVAFLGCVCQLYDRQYLPTRFISRKLSRSESRWAIADLEAQAIGYSITKWSQYLLVKPFYVCSDHKGLRIYHQVILLEVGGSTAGRFYYHSTNFTWFMYLLNLIVLLTLSHAILIAWARPCIERHHSDKL